MRMGGKEGREGSERREGGRQNRLRQCAAIILAAGEGTRIKARRKNKVAYKLTGKPMIRYVAETLSRVGIGQIIVVVKYFETSVREALRGKKVIFARQGDKKGTAAALEDGLKAISKGEEEREGQEGRRQYNKIIVMYGDDSAFYSEDLFRLLSNEHDKSRVDVTLLSIKVDDPTGLGRILRNKQGKVLGIVEEKVATDEQKKITEINTGCYCFNRDFIERRVGEIEKNPISQEYYLTDIVEVALRHGEKVHVFLYPDNSVWFGVNTRSQWAKAMRKKKYDING